MPRGKGMIHGRDAKRLVPDTYKPPVLYIYKARGGFFLLSLSLASVPFDKCMYESAFVG